MPTPIQPSGTNGSNVSFLPTLSPDVITSLEALSSRITGSSVGDLEADMLIDLWTKGKRISSHRYEIPNGYSDRNISKLKTSGLIVVQGRNVEFTSKASNVIKTMVLSEQNSFFLKSQKKPYSMILAESKKPVRTSNLTHTAQTNTSANDLNSCEVVWSRRIANISDDPTNRSSPSTFKEYTVRVYKVDDIYQVWGFWGGIGDPQKATRKGSDYGSQLYAQADAMRIIQRELRHGYRLGSELGDVVCLDPRKTRKYRRHYNLGVENETLPGVFNNATNSNVGPRNPPANPGSSRTPTAPATPARSPTAPSVTPRAHVQDRELPDGYSTSGPVSLQEPAYQRSEPESDWRLGWYITDPDGQIVQHSAGDTPTVAINRAKPWIAIQVAEKSLPPGFTISGPPRVQTARNMFIVKNQAGTPITLGYSLEEVVREALKIVGGSINTGPAQTAPSTPVDSKLAEQKKKAQELNEKLPEGYRLESFYASERNTHLWYVLKPDGSNVVGELDGKDVVISGNSPKIAYDKFIELRNREAQELSEKAYQLMLDSYEKDREARIRARIVTAQNEAHTGPVDTVELRKKFIKEAFEYLEGVGTGLSPYGFRRGQLFASEVISPNVNVWGYFDPVNSVAQKARSIYVTLLPIKSTDFVGKPWRLQFYTSPPRNSKQKSFGITRYLPAPKKPESVCKELMEQYNKDQVLGDIASTIPSLGIPDGYYIRSNSGFNTKDDDKYPGAPWGLMDEQWNPVEDIVNGEKVQVQGNTPKDVADWFKRIQKRDEDKKSIEDLSEASLRYMQEQFGDEG